MQPPSAEPSPTPVTVSDQVKAQMEGGLIYGPTATLLGEITLDQGRVQRTNFHTLTETIGSITM